MNTNDWITLVSACVAAFAFLVSARALQLQRAGAKGSTQQQFDELVHQLGITLGKFAAPVSQPPGAAGFPPGAPTAMGEVQTLALRAHDLLYPPADGARRIRWYRRVIPFWNPSSAVPEHNWFDAVTLALSFAQVWDTQRARGYWDSAARLAMADTEIGPSAEIYTQRFLGAFYYSINTEDDLARARSAYDRAASILNPELNGPDITYDMNHETRILQAQQEDQLGNTAQAGQYLREAWQLSANVRAQWRRQRARSQFVAAVIYGGDPRRFDDSGGLPAEIMQDVARALGQQQMPQAPYHGITDAWRQSYASARQLFAGADPPAAQSPGDLSATGVPGLVSPDPSASAAGVAPGAFSLDDPGRPPPAF